MAVPLAAAPPDQGQAGVDPARSQCADDDGAPGVGVDAEQLEGGVVEVALERPAVTR